MRRAPLPAPPAPVRVVLVVDLAIAVVYGLGALLGRPGGPLGDVVVAAQAAVCAAVIVHWAFPAFWSWWLAVVEGFFVADRDVARVRLPAWPARRATLLGAGALLLSAGLQATWGNAAGAGYRSVVNAFVLCGGLSGAALAVVQDVRRMLAATARTDR